MAPQVKVPYDRAQLCAGIDADLRKAFELIDAGTAPASPSSPTSPIPIALP